MSHNYRTWSPEQEAKLLKLLDNYTYLTAQEIGDRLGVTRNSVIGKINRLRRQEGRAKSGDNNLSALRKMRKKPITAKEIADRFMPPALVCAAAPKAQRVPPMSLKLSKASMAPAPAPVKTPHGDLYTTITIGHGQCRFPYNDTQDSNFHYCANPGFPWCEYHAKICYTPATGPIRKVA